MAQFPILEGVRVVEVGGDVAVAYATKLLGDLGADVGKLEPAGGDPLRTWGSGGLFRYLNAGKRDVSTIEGDVIIDSTATVTLERLPLFTGALVRISSFGEGGPYQDLEVSPLVLQAMSGWVSAHGVVGYDPFPVGGRLDEYVVGTFAAAAALTGLRAAEIRGEPVIADLSMLECLVGTLSYPMLWHETLSALGLPPPEARHSVLPGIVRCADGWAGINALTGQHWRDVCTLLGAEEFADRQRELAWGGPELDRFFARVQPVLDQHRVEDIVELSQAFRVPAAPVGDGASLPALAQFRYRRFYREERDGGALWPGAPYRLSPGSRAQRDAPGGEPDYPWAGLRVIDLGTFWAGPYVGLYLGAMGADVIKIESARRPDGFRFSAAFPEEGDDWYERSGLWQATNLNKRSVTLDLNQADGLAMLRDLISDADVVIENFSVRVMEQFGLGRAEVLALAPGIIYLRMPGFGLEGPWRDYVGWAMAFEQASGMAQVSGDGKRPMHPGGFLDPVVGMHAVVAVQAALRHRQQTGEGQFIELAQLEVGACLTAEQVIEWSLIGRLLAGEGSRDRRVAHQGVYRCARDRWVAVSARDGAERGRLAELVGAGADLDEGIVAWVAGRTVDDAVVAFRSAGLPAGRVLIAAEMYDDAQLAARGYFQAIEHPVSGVRRYPGWPMRFSFGPPMPHRTSAPTLGQHNQEVLGLAEADLESLTAQGVIGTRLAF